MPYKTGPKPPLTVEMACANKHRVEHYTEATDKCWNWKGPVNKSSRGTYGNLGIGKGLRYLAHRISYMIHKGDIPDDMLVLHTCDNTLCVNPEHLYLGSDKKNTDDRFIRNRNFGKLVKEDAAEIKRLLDGGEHTQAEIASMFNISQSHVSHISTGREWSQYIPYATT